MKKLLCLLLILTLLITNLMPAFASPLDDQLNKLEKKYNIEIIKEKNIPANIKPVELKNIDELRMVLEDYANYSETGIVEYGSIQNTTISPKGLYPSITLYHNYTLVIKTFKLLK